MEWVAIDVHIAGDAVTHRLADAFRLRVAEAAGLLTLAFAGMAQHAQDGSLGPVTDSQIEAWAFWHGKRGAFAAFFRAQLCDEDGTVRAWEQYNGAAIREAKAARERMRAYRARNRAAREGEREHTQNANGTPNGTANGTRNVRHNLTGHDLTSTTQPQKKPKGADKPRGESAPWMGLMRTAWTIGTLPAGSAKSLAPVVGEIGADECAARLASYCEEVDPQYASVRGFVTRHANYASTGRLAVDPETGLPNAIGIAALTGRRA